MFTEEQTMTYIVSLICQKPQCYCIKQPLFCVEFYFFFSFLYVYFLTPKTFCIGVSPINNVMVVSGEHYHPTKELLDENERKE